MTLRASCFVLVIFGGALSACGSSSSGDTPAGTAGAGGDAAGGAAGTTSAGGTSAGGTSAGGTSAGGTSAGGTSAGGSAGASADAMAACMAEATASCAKRDQCQDQLATREYGSAADCATRLAAACVKTLAAPGQGNTAAAVTTCAQTITSATCADFLAPTGVCPQAKGTGANGSACEYAGQCSSGYCSTLAGVACGTCAELPKAGDACNTTCGAQALACDRTTGKCVAVVASGAKCDPTNVCGAGFDCVGYVAKTMTQGTCTASGATAGADCDPTLATGARCDRNAGLDCDKTTKKCAAITVATPGQTCGNDKMTGAVTICGGGSGCETAAGGTSTCVAFAMDGAACDAAVGPACLPPASCILPMGSGGTSGTCQLPDASLCK